LFCTFFKDDRSPLLHVLTLRQIYSVFSTPSDVVIPTEGSVPSSMGAGSAGIYVTCVTRFNPWL